MPKQQGFNNSTKNDMEIENLLPKSTYSNADDIKAFNLDRPFSDNISFTAIDFETATYSRKSICEIGISIVENGLVKNTKSWLVKPPYNEYFPFNTYIHGISAKDTANSPTLKEVWPEVLPYLDGKIVVAHNTSFDMYVLRDSILANDMVFPNFAFYCSCRLSKKVVSGCYSYSLPCVCEALGIDFNSHHKAGADAEGCAKVFLECLKLSGATSYADLQDKYNFRCGRFSENYFRPQFANHKGGGGAPINLNAIIGDPSKIDEGNYFYGKEVCFTGKCQFGIRTELLQMVANVGGIPVNSVTSHTDVLVVGQQDYRIVGEDGMSSKQEKAMRLKDKGQDIEIMSESEFLSNI